jgi:hypothetical protein
MGRLRVWDLVSLAVLVGHPVVATITLPNFYGSSMVLRADVEVVIHGMEGNPSGEGSGFFFFFLFCKV